MIYKFGNNQRPQNRIPPGIHQVRIKDARAGDSANGNPMIRLDLLEPQLKAILRDQLVLTENCFWKLDEFLRCFDLDLSVGDSLDFDQEFLDSLVGLTGTVQVKDQLFNGQKVSKVVAYLPAEDSQLVEDTE
jgi:Protein of unknown function (DUF669)